MTNKLQKAYKDYITFLGRIVDENAGFLYCHGVQCNETDLKEGERLRKVIADLEIKQ